MRHQTATTVITEGRASAPDVRAAVLQTLDGRL